MNLKWALPPVTIIFISLLISASVLVDAATPTPVPTDTPIPTATMIHSPTPVILNTLRPTVTESYIYLRPTPTLLPVSGPNPNLDIHADNGMVADQTINIYRYFNHDHIFDYICMVILAFVSVFYIVRIIGRTTNIK